MSSPASAERSAALEAAYVAACALELRALKPGNVHDFAAGHGMTVGDFAVSAEVSAPPLCRSGASVGERILGAIRATRERVGCNTNLGIVLLAAPLIAAAERGRPPLRQAVAAILAGLTQEDAAAAYEAIRLAAPAGLGRVEEQDVAEAPSITLGAAMALAAPRDRIARQYAEGFADVFDIGVARSERSAQRGIAPDWNATLVFMDFLAAFPDSHVARKYGDAIAEEVRGKARALAPTLGDHAGAENVASLLALDQWLKERRLNPGSSADLTVASLLAHAAASILDRV